MSKDKEKPAKTHINIPSGTDLNSDTNDTTEEGGDSGFKQQSSSTNKNEEHKVHSTSLETTLCNMAEFRFNTITRFPEIRYNGTEKWAPLDEYTLNSLVRALKKQGLPKVYKSTVSNLLHSDFSKKANPIKEYFEGLAPVTGNIIERMAATVTLAGDPNLKEHRAKTFQTFFTKWLVGAVANVFIDDRCANHFCLIISGPQGTFKSTWISNLCPAALSDYYVEGSLDPDNKDSILATATNFIFNLDDYFAGITSRKINEFKGLITKNTVKIRQPYSRYPEELPKVCSFVASSNEAQFLHDTTGNRRFLPFEISKTDIKAAKAINIDHLWAQAVKLFKSGYTYWLTQKDKDMLDELNNQFEVQSNEYEVLVTYLQPPKEGETPEADLTNAEILAHLQDKVTVKLSTRRLGEALRKAGFHRIQKRRGGCRTWVYGVIYADEADIYTGRQPSVPGSSQSPE